MNAVWEQLSIPYGWSALRRRHLLVRFVMAELLRRLHGGAAYEIISASLLSLEDIEVAGKHVSPWSFGHTTVS